MAISLAVSLYVLELSVATKMIGTPFCAMPAQCRMSQMVKKADTSPHVPLYGLSLSAEPFGRYAIDMLQLPGADQTGIYGTYSHEILVHHT